MRCLRSSRLWVGTPRCSKRECRDWRELEALRLTASVGLCQMNRDMSERGLAMVTAVFLAASGRL